MKLTPLDIRNREFARTFRGYSPVEVQSFLDAAADRLEEALREAEVLRGEVARAREQIEEYRARERDIRDTLLEARKVAQETREAARKEAEILLAEAELEGEDITREARERRVTLVQEVAALRAQRERLLAEIRGVLEAHTRLLRVEAEGDPLLDLVAGAEEEAEAEAEVEGEGKGDGERRPPAGRMGGRLRPRSGGREAGLAGEAAGAGTGAGAGAGAGAGKAAPEARGEQPPIVFDLNPSRPQRPQPGETAAATGEDDGWGDLGGGSAS